MHVAIIVYEYIHIFVPLMVPETVSNVCSQGQFACSSGFCITALWVCDGEEDCAGGDDETGCCKWIVGCTGTMHT